MPIYMDRHDLPGVTAKDVADAHHKDLKIQHDFGCRALTYWFDATRQTAFCLIEAPDKESVKAMHKNAHGLVPHQVIEVNSHIVEAFLGRLKDPVSATETNQDYINESAFRFILLIRFEFPLSNHTIEDNNKASFYNTLQENLHKYGGRQVTNLGSDIICSFTSSEKAIQCALNIKQSLNTQKTFSTQNSRLQWALSAGSPISKGDNFFEEPLENVKKLAYLSFNNKIITPPIISDSLQKEGSKVHINNTELQMLSQVEVNFGIQLITALQKNLQKADFTLHDLAQEMSMSKSQLFRKIKVLTHLAPNAFLKEFKLIQALKLMELKVKSISEIAFETGFGSPSYFSKCFKKRFAIHPSSYDDALPHQSNQFD